MERQAYVTNPVTPHHTSTIYYHAPLFHPITHTYHSQTYYNEKIALVKRHCKPIQTTGKTIYGTNRTTECYTGLTRKFIKYAEHLMASYRPKTNFQPYTHEQYINTMPAKYKYFLNKDTSNFTDRVKTFIKKEKIDPNKRKPPRLIQANHMKYNIEIGRYTKKLEHYLYDADKRHNKFNFAKGIDMKQMAHHITKKADRFINPKFIGLDHSTFDAFVTNDHKKIVNSFILKTYKNNRLLQSYLNRKYIKGETSKGIKYKIEGTINSGSPITSLSANIINYTTIHYILHKILKIKKFEIIVNGDDSLIIIERSAHINSQRLTKEFAKMNFNTKIDYITTDITQVEFCRCGIAKDNTGTPTCYLKPERIIKMFGQTHKTIERKSYIRDIAYAYSIIYKNLENYHQEFNRIYQHYDKIAKKPLLKQLNHEPLIKILYEKEKNNPRVIPSFIHSSQPSLPHLKIIKRKKRTSNTKFR